MAESESYKIISWKPRNNQRHLTLANINKLENISYFPITFVFSGKHHTHLGTMLKNVHVQT